MEPAASQNHSAEPSSEGRQARQPTARTMGHKSMTSHTVATRKALFCSPFSPSWQGRDGFDKSHISAFLVALQVSPEAKVAVCTSDNKIL